MIHAYVKDLPRVLVNSSKAPATPKRALRGIKSASWVHWPTRVRAVNVSLAWKRRKNIGSINVLTADIKRAPTFLGYYPRGLGHLHAVCIFFTRIGATGAFKMSQTFWKVNDKDFTYIWKDCVACAIDTFDEERGHKRRERIRRHTSSENFLSSALIISSYDGKIYSSIVWSTLTERRKRKTIFACLQVKYLERHHCSRLRYNKDACLI